MIDSRAAIRRANEQRYIIHLAHAWSGSRSVIQLECQRVGVHDPHVSVANPCTCHQGPPTAQLDGRLNVLSNTTYRLPVPDKGQNSTPVSLAVGILSMRENEMAYPLYPFLPNLPPGFPLGLRQSVTSAVVDFERLLNDFMITCLSRQSFHTVTLAPRPAASFSSALTPSFRRHSGRRQHVALRRELN